MSSRTLKTARPASFAALLIVLAACSSSPGESSAAPAAPTRASTPSSEPSASAAAESEAAASTASVEVAESDLGQILTDADGKVIYFFANDEEGVSNCEGECLTNWPPVTVEGSPTAGDGVDAELGTVDGNDGSTQLTINGYPAYYFAGDSAPGDTNGQGVGDVWWVFGADGEPIEG